jgi:hypothetical protein
MKSIKSGLLTSSLIAAFMMISVIAAQAQNAAGQNKDLLTSQERIVAVQAGTVQLVNGNLTVALSETTLKQLKGKADNYFVSLTPIGETGQLKLKEKTGNQFTVRELAQQGSNGTFDYIVMVKKIIYTGIKPEVTSK